MNITKKSVLIVDDVSMSRHINFSEWQISFKRFINKNRLI